MTVEDAPAQAAAAPRQGAVKGLIRWLLGLVGLRIFSARGGVFICPTPRASRYAGHTGDFQGRRLYLGCGNIHLDGYVNIDIVESAATDMVADVTSLPMIPSDCIEEIRMEAVLEHFFRHQRLSALQEWRRILKPGGTLDVRFIPDFDVYAGRYVRGEAGMLSDPMGLDEVYRFTHGEPLPFNAPEQIHKDIFTRASVRRDVEAAGLEVVSLESVCFRDEPIALNLNLVARKPGG